MKRAVETLKDMADRNRDITVIYFWGHTPNPKTITDACFSTRYECRLELDGV